MERGPDHHPHRTQGEQGHRLPRATITFIANDVTGADVHLRSDDDSHLLTFDNTFVIWATDGLGSLVTVGLAISEAAGIVHANARREFLLSDMTFGNPGCDECGMFDAVVKIDNRYLCTAHNTHTTTITEPANAH